MRLFVLRTLSVLLLAQLSPDPLPPDTQSPSISLASGAVTPGSVPAASIGFDDLWLVQEGQLLNADSALGRVGQGYVLVRGLSLRTAVSAGAPNATVSALKITPAMKVARALQSGADASNVRWLTVIPAPDRSPQTTLQAIRSVVPDADLALDRTTSPPAVTVKFRSADVVARLARLPQVLWIEPRVQPVTFNSESVGPLQANAPSAGQPPTATPIWDQDLMGTGQIIAVADSGLDRNENWFTQLNRGLGTFTAITDAQMTQPPTPGTLSPNNKVVGYFVMPGASAYDNNAPCGIGGNAYHGTHVTGTAAGDSGTASTPVEPHHDPADGMAPQAQILFQDLGDDSGGCLTGQGGGPMWAQARASGARIHSNSYGGLFSGSYNVQDFAVDDFLWRHEDMLLVFAAGNAGGQPGDSRVAHFGHAKHALTVAALGRGDNPAVWSQSSRGPASDGRLKPDLGAPGVQIRSARGDSNNTGFEPPEQATFSGTSMATPGVAGAAALARQYFVDGFYPSGLRNAADIRSPSGVLLKALLLNGTRSDANTPQADAGWGRVWLDSNLYFAGDSRQLRVWDLANVSGLATGESITVPLTVTVGQPLRATLVWYDPPPSFLAPTALVNNLDLVVQGPDGTLLGNVIAGGNSVTGGNPDLINPVEQVMLADPTPGSYSVSVSGADVPGNGEPGSRRQGFALVVASGECASGVTDPPGFDLSTDASGVQVTVDPVVGAAGYQVYRRPGSCATGEERFIGYTSSTSLNDPNAQGGLTYAYRVRGVDGCGEGPPSACRAIESNGPCTLSPLASDNPPTIQTPGSFCAAQLSWFAATPRCAGAQVSYEVHRDTDPFFMTSPSTLLAGGLPTPRYSDYTPAPSQTHYYRFVAVDTEGNRSEPSAVVSYSAVDTQSNQPGPYADGAELLALAVTEPPWQITSVTAASGVRSYVSASPGQRYPANACAALTTRPMVLDPAAALSFAARFEVESDFDGVVTEISVNNGPWQDLPPAGGYPGAFALTGSPPLNACGYPNTQGAFNGSSGGAFTTYQRDLGAFEGQEVRLRWRLSSDSFQAGEGFFLDTIQVTNATQPAACIPNELLFATSFE